MRRAILTLVSVCALAACNPAAPAGQTAANDAGGSGAFPDLNGAAFRAEATITSTDGTTIPVVMIRDGRKMRMEVNAPQGAATIITNGDTGESFVISTQAGRQIAIRADSLGQGLENPVDEWQGDLAESATRSGTCTVAGETGAEWTKTTAEDGTDTVCVTQDGIILRATDDGRVAWETTSVQRGPQSAELFALPEGVQTLDLGNAFNQALEAAQRRGN
ncbi:MAG: hypothetical protein R3C27_01185 [Hyphomonadaceae bacterium]